MRILHWALLFFVVASWLTRHGFGSTHEWLGYAALGVVTLRLVWGFTGPEHARFSYFVHGPRKTLRYFSAALRGGGARHLGHNPLGAWMSLALLLTVLLICASGWLYTTDRFWGVAWVEALHDGFTWALIVLLCVHLAGVIWTSFKTRENLALSMVNGRKRAPDESAP